MSRRVVDNVVALKESHGFLRGLVGLVGFRQTSVLYDRDPRAAGTSKYNRFWGSLRDRPQRRRRLLALSAAADLDARASRSRGSRSCSRVVYLGLKLGGVTFPVGNPTIVIVVAFFSGIQLLSLGVIGEYVGRIYDESRDRPKYIVESRYGWDELSRVRSTRLARRPIGACRRSASSPAGSATRLGERVRDTPKPLLEVAGRAVPAAPAATARRARRARASCSASATSASRSSSAIGTERFGIEIAYSYDAPGARRHARRDPARAAAARRALPGALRRHLPADRLRGVARVWERERPAGGDDGAAQRGPLGHLERVYRDGLVLAYDKRAPTPEMHWIDYGLGGLTIAGPSRPRRRRAGPRRPLPRLAAPGMLFGYEATERFYEIGTPQALAETDAFLRSARAGQRRRRVSRLLNVPVERRGPSASAKRAEPALAAVRPAWVRACASRCPEASSRSCT